MESISVWDFVFLIILSIILIYFTYLDFRFREIKNLKFIAPYLIGTIKFTVDYKDTINNFLFYSIFFIYLSLVNFLLFKINFIGGADVKSSYLIFFLYNPINTLGFTEMHDGYQFLIYLLISFIFNFFMNFIKNSRIIRSKMPFILKSIGLTRKIFLLFNCSLKESSKLKNYDKKIFTMEKLNQSSFIVKNDLNFYWVITFKPLLPIISICLLITILI